ncbi:50S ribosomal protein L9 [Desulfotomaculum copahuensis]|uniref:Large ribosomal subunit protein bL9 n=1 Tax=Desulfotomaculum copahuensis TaxID=1838280 RepID=A0A1B7LDB1_9FIRM|nr:50S ribosomal protein L9 [Desulfotomaculum copahuensis]OAT80865.1 50S ribosomal protein L9 [Desulfotomaculum copahuensis]
MKVILLEDVKSLGQKGDVVNVSDGYARNFLLPRQKAVEASAGKMKELSQQKAVQVKKKQAEETAARELGARLEGLTVQIKSRVGEGGKLFGAVSSKDVADALFREHKLTVDKKKIVLKEPIKQLGVHPLVVKLHPAVQATINVNVVGG